MGMEVLEGLRVSQSQQCPLSRKINKQIHSHPVNVTSKERHFFKQHPVRIAPPGVTSFIQIARYLGDILPFVTRPIARKSSRTAPKIT